MLPNNKKLTVAIIGAGQRGLYAYGAYILNHPMEAKVVAVAEPRNFYRNEAARLHGIARENIFTDWKELSSKPRLADIAVIATPDRLHYEPAVALAKKGYHILLEKPIAPIASECVEIVKAAQNSGVLLAVCHVLKYAPFYRKIKQIIDSGQIGEVCSIQQLEGVGWWHFAHSYVRGNFRKTADSSSMLLAKACHDLDIIRWWAGEKCLRVASFGYLKHFRRDRKPKRAAQRCIECELSMGQCPYSAKSFYFKKLNNKQYGWPLTMVINDFNEAALTEALRSGPYGHCVYQNDNDVVDHQVVIMDFEGQITAELTVSAFTPYGRQIKVMGSNGYIEGQEHRIKVLDFTTEQWTEYDVNKLSTDITGGHGGGDSKIMEVFLNTVRSGKSDALETGADIAIESHLMAFAAEKSRIEGRVVETNEILNNTNPTNTTSIL